MAWSVNTGTIRGERRPARKSGRVKSVSTSSVSGCKWRREWPLSYPLGTGARASRVLPQGNRLKQRSCCLRAFAMSALISKRPARGPASSAPSPSKPVEVNRSSRVSLTAPRTHHTRLPTGSRGPRHRSFAEVPSFAAPHIPPASAFRRVSTVQGRQAVLS